MLKRILITLAVVIVAVLLFQAFVVGGGPTPVSQ